MKLAALFLALLASTAHAQVSRTLLVGDSITVHMAMDVNLGGDVAVFAAGGARVTEGGQYAVPAAVAYHAGWGGEPLIDRVVILLGVNDWKRQPPLPRFRLAYTQMIGGIPVPVTCVLPIPNRDEAALARPLEWYRKAIADVCSDVRDPREVIPEWTPDLYKDATHLSPEGSAVLAGWLLGQGM